MAEIFVSYKREDRARVEPLVRLLEREGFSVWWDPTLVAGERFGLVIHREIETARCVVVAWSASSVNAVWVCDEAAAGRDRGILVPLSLDGVTPPLGFRQYQTPDFSNWSGDAEDHRAVQFLAGVRRLVRDGAAPIPTDAGAARVPIAVAPATAPAAPLRTSIPRRRLLQLGLGVAGVGVASAAAMMMFDMPARLRRGVPAPHAEKFDLVTVDDTGDEQPSQPQTIDVFDAPLNDTTSLEFSIVPAGGFQIGSPEHEPQRRSNEGPQEFVELKEFAMTRTAITQGQWAAVVNRVEETGGQTLAPYPSFFRGDDLPVETISWNHATEFCRRLSKVTGFRCRLPSEAEWEYACRARTTTPFHFGPTLTSDLANYCGTGGAVCGMDRGEDISSDVYNNMAFPRGAYDRGPIGGFKNGTMPARAYPPNRFGLFQMHGNVWEHCLDTALAEYRLIPKDGAPYVGPGGDHVLRGGAWSHNAAICRSAYRDAMRSDSVGWQGRVGMRVVCEL